MGELAVLSIIAAEVKRGGRCMLPVDAIAAMAGVCRSTVQNAQRQARRLGLLTVTERRRRGAKSDTNVIEVIDPAWLAWLKMQGRKGHRAQENKHHEISLLHSTVNAGESPHNPPVFSLRSGHPPAESVLFAGDVHDRLKSGRKARLYR